MSDSYRSTGPGLPVQREIGGNASILGGMGSYRYIQSIDIPAAYQGKSFKWGGFIDESLPLSLALLTNCLAASGVQGETAVGDVAWRLHREFAAAVIDQLDGASPLVLDWYEVQSWIDNKISATEGPLARCVRRIRNFERLLKEALDEENAERPRRIDPKIWGRWDIETVASICILENRFNPPILTRFIDHLLDLKFKLYCLVEVDLPAYAAAVEKWHLDVTDLESTPQGFVARLSEEVTLIIKARAVWESVMNVAYWHANGRDLPGAVETDDLGITYKSKKAKFFPWAAANPQWSSLATFKSLVDELETLRMSEVHRFSRVRANFTNTVLEPIDQCVMLLNRILIYVFDHFVTVIVLGGTATYDAASFSTMTTIS